MALEQLEAKAEMTTDTGKTRRAIKPLHIAMLVVAIMATEGLIGWWALSRSQNAAASEAGGKGQAAADGEATEAANDKPAPSGDVALKEVELGAFQLSLQTSASGALHVQLSLSATVPEELENEFHEMQERHKSRIRQSVLSIVRSSTQEDLADPSLSLIRRKIQDQLNRLLEKKYLVDIIVTEVSIIGQ